MGIKLIKKESAKSAPHKSEDAATLDAATFVKPSFGAVAYDASKKNEDTLYMGCHGFFTKDGKTYIIEDESPEWNGKIVGKWPKSDWARIDTDKVIRDWRKSHPTKELRNKKHESAPAKNEERVTSYFVLHKNADLKAIEKIVATLEDAILNDQTVETTANPDGTVSIDIYGKMTPDAVARAMQLPGQLGTSYVDLAINIEG